MASPSLQGQFFRDALAQWLAVHQLYASRIWTVNLGVIHRCLAVLV